MQKYSRWLLTAAVLQLIAATIHAITLFITQLPANETEKQLFTLMDTYRFDFGAGFHRTMGELLLALSACFSLVCMLGGMLNWYLLRKKADPEIVQGVVTINLVVFGILFGLTVVFAFLLPIILAGLIFLFLSFSRIAIIKAMK